MSVCGNVTPYKTKLWGAPDIPFIDVLHFRASRATDLRPFAARGGQYWAAETAMGILRGLGPVGADFWLLTAEERGPQSRPGSVETPTSNLGMGSFTTAAYLAPGPDGPIPTARFEVFRQGLQMCEARTVLEKALADQAVRKQLDPALVKRCEETLAAHNRAFQFVTAGENYAQGEGWKWYESSGWESDAGRLFAAAAEVRAALPAPPAPPR
jgi:hypothetical protein